MLSKRFFIHPLPNKLIIATTIWWLVSVINVSNATLMGGRPSVVKTCQWVKELIKQYGGKFDKAHQCMARPLWNCCPWNLVRGGKKAPWTHWIALIFGPFHRTQTKKITWVLLAFVPNCMNLIQPCKIPNNNNINTSATWKKKQWCGWTMEFIN
jgi:hypothetical protein